MLLLVVILILLVWAGYGIIKSMQPTHPFIEDMEEHLKYIQGLPNSKARQKYLRNGKTISKN